MDDAEMTLSDNAFQILVAATGKASLLIFGSLKDGTARQLIRFKTVC